jgi:DNA primase
MEKKNTRGLITKDTIDKIKEAANVLDVIRDYVPDLKKKGNEWVAKSPKGGDNTPSFTVNPQKNIFKDFSAGPGGDSVAFLMDYQAMTYVQALEYLATKYGIEIERENQKSIPTPRPIMDDRTRQLFDINAWMTDQFEDQLWNQGNGSKGLDYMLLRGVPEELLKKYHVGYAVASFDNLKKKGRDKFNCPYEDLERASTIKRHTNGNHFYDFFFDRVMFPIMNAEGKTIGFGGRTIAEIPPDTPKDKHPPKYLNSHESYIFKKGSTFFGLYQALEAIRKFNFVYIVEGYLDVLAFATAGIFNVVSLNGTAMNENGLKLLSRYTRNFVIAMDGDGPGKKAIHYQLQLLLKYNTSETQPVKVITFPGNTDPNEYLNRKGVEAFKEFIKANTNNFVIELINTHWREETLPEKKAGIIKLIVKLLCYIEDRFLRDTYFQELQQRTGFAMETIKAEETEVILKREEAMRVFNEKMEKLASKGKGALKRNSPYHTLIKILVKFGGQPTPEGVLMGKFIINMLEHMEINFPDQKQSRMCNAVATLLQKKQQISFDNITRYYPELDGYLRELKEPMQDYELLFSRSTNPSLDTIMNMIRPSIIEGELEKVDRVANPSLAQRLTDAMKTYPNYH